MLGDGDHVGLAFAGQGDALGCERRAEIGGTAFECRNLLAAQAQQTTGNGLDLAERELNRGGPLALDGVRQGRARAPVNIDRSGNQPGAENERRRQHRPDSDVATVIARQGMKVGELAASLRQRTCATGKIGNETNNNN
ncbi:hypothetical protein D9M72_472300 [compost metagenome]